MAFENGYNIMEYIGNTVEKYNNDKTIFSKALQLLNVYMNRNDWPYCYKEYYEISKEILGDDCEWVSKYYLQFSSQARKNHSSLLNWDEELPQEFKAECSTFALAIAPIINQYYDYINSPLGVRSLIQINNFKERKIIRIVRNDGEFLDLNLHNFDISQLADALLNTLNEG